MSKPCFGSWLVQRCSHLEASITTAISCKTLVGNKLLSKIGRGRLRQRRRNCLAIPGGSYVHHIRSDGKAVKSELMGMRSPFIRFETCKFWTTHQRVERGGKWACQVGSWIVRQDSRWFLIVREEEREPCMCKCAHICWQTMLARPGGWHNCARQGQQGEDGSL